MICYLNDQVIVEEVMMGWGSDGQTTTYPAHCSSLYSWMLKPTQAQQKKQVYIYHLQNASVISHHSGWEKKNNFLGSFFLYCHLHIMWLLSMCMAAGAMCKVVCGSLYSPQARICLLLTLTMNPKSSDSSFLCLRYWKKRIQCKWVLPPKPS